MNNSCSNTAKPAKLSIVVALACEARPLIQALKLKKQPQSNALSVFINAEQSIQVIVSGMGKLNAAIATTYAHSLTDYAEHHCLLNLGIAGAGGMDIGRVCGVHTIVDAATQREYFPEFIQHNRIAAFPLHCHDQVQMNYHDQQMIDMEASGFYLAATQFVAREQVRLLKIISDNSAEHLATINANVVETLIADNIDLVGEVIAELKHYSSSIAAVIKPLVELTPFIERWHFSTYQQHQLQELLRRWSIIKSDSNALQAVTQATNSKQVLSVLQSTLQDCSYVW